MLRGIVWIDMQIRDQRVFDWLTTVTATGPKQISHQEIAEEFSCHRLTARAIIHRLIGAGLVEADTSAARGGYVYSVVKRQ